MPTGLQKLRAIAFHIWFLIRRPMTLGVRGVVHDAGSGSVFLIRHTYVPGWQLPGGGVEVGETMAGSLAREVEEECNVEIEGTPRLVSVHLNRQATRRDHVALYLISDFRVIGPKIADREIAEAGFFPLDALPDGTTPATRRRLSELFEGARTDPYW